MNVLSLFSGIGGLELGLERAGMTVVGQVEIDPYCRRVLDKHWPEVPKHDDVRTCAEWWLGTVDVADPEGSGWRTGRPGRSAVTGAARQGFSTQEATRRGTSGRGRPTVDLVCGGFPCQPVSLAGQQLAQADPRWLWPAFATVVRRLRPRYVLVENVPGLLAHGMGDVLGDLADFGYDAEWDRVPAAFVGAPHIRGRIFIVAYPNGQLLEGAELLRIGDGQQSVNRNSRNATALADANSERWDGRPRIFRSGRRPESTDGGQPLADPEGDRRPAEGQRSPAGHLDWGGQLRPEPPTHWVVEPDVGRVAHGVPARVDRLRALGNAVVPQVAEHVGRLILDADWAGVP